MNGNTENNLVLVGAPYLLSAIMEPELKGKLMNVIIEQGFIPVELCLTVPENEQHYAHAHKQLSRSCACNLLWIGSNLNVSEFLEKEFAAMLRTGKPVIVMMAEGTPEFRKKFAFIRKMRKRAESSTPSVYVHTWADASAAPKELRKALKKIKKPARPPAPVMAWVPNLSGPELFADSVSFTGYYYSSVRLAVRKFHLRVGASPLNGHPEYGRHSAVFWKTIGDDPFARHDEEETFDGVAFLQSGFLHFDLGKRLEPRNSLHLRVYFGNSHSLNAINRHDVMFGSIQGLTTDGTTRNYSYKTILVRDDPGIPDKTRELTILQAERHLYLSRKSFLTKLEVLRYDGDAIKHMTVDGNRIDKAEHMEGVYRVWTEVRRAGETYILQSMMIIDCNYRSRFRNHIVDDGEEQLCEIHFSQHSGKEKLIFTMRRITNEGAGGITSTAMMEFPREDEMREVLIGSYSSVGKDPGFQHTKKGRTPKLPPTEVRGGFFVAKLEKLEKNFEVNLIPARQFEDDPKYAEMLRFLREKNGRRSHEKSGKKY